MKGVFVCRVNVNLVAKNCAGAMMQTAAAYASYSHAYHAAIAGTFVVELVFEAVDRLVYTGPQDHELKKQYLALLPPQQIIDICLNFDLYVPPYAKTTVWPADIKAAIAALTNPSPPAVHTNGALAVGKSSTPQPASEEPPGGNQPPDKSPPTPGPTPAPPSTSSDLSQPNSQCTAQPVPQQPPYPHQPYGYPLAQPAYPHTPYYPPGYPAYPGYPSYPGYPQPQHPQNTPQAQPPSQQDLYGSNAHSVDDLPSYEDMIAEALLDSADPDGCAPKDLFTWMAGRYPLQSNFRPSASQALQKAYKRGRFFKTTGGKYRLNAAWEGGTVSIYT